MGCVGEDSAAIGVDGDQSDTSAQSSGAVYVFTRNDGQWSQEAYLKASNTDSGDLFGSSVCLSGDLLAVGAERESSIAVGVNGPEDNNSAPNSGAAYVFVRKGGIWSQELYLKPTNTDASDEFGGSVAVSNGTVVVGAVFEDGVNSESLGSGAAYLLR